MPHSRDFQTGRALLVALGLAGLPAACTPPVSTAPEQAAEGPKAAAPAASNPAPDRAASTVAEVCAQCHDVGSGSGPAIYAKGAAAFKEIANRPGSSVESFAEWMSSANHPSMPHYMFNKQDVADLAAYIMRMREAK